MISLNVNSLSTTVERSDMNDKAQNLVCSQLGLHRVVSMLRENDELGLSISAMAFLCFRLMLLCGSPCL